MKKLLLILIFFITSCSSVIIYDYSYPQKSASDIAVYSSTRPDCPYKEIGVLSDGLCLGGVNAMISWAKQQAADIGGDFIEINDHCGIRFYATVFVCEKSGKKSKKIYLEK